MEFCSKALRATLKIIFFYAVIYKSGLLSPASPPLLVVLHSKPFLCLAAIAAACSLALLIQSVRLPSKRERAGGICVYLGLLLLCVSLFVSQRTHFSGKWLVLEGQTKLPSRTEYVAGSIYAPGTKDVPPVGLSLGSLAQQTTPDASSIRKIWASLTYTSGNHKPENYTITRYKPLFTASTLVYISDFGYAVRHRITDAGVEKDGDVRYLKLFPAGQEDSFTPYYYGYTFYLRLYPDFHPDAQGRPASRSADLRDPVLHVRVTRNKDVMFDDYMRMHQTILFDGIALQFPQILKWGEFTVVKDAGLYLAVPALLILAAGSLLLVPLRRKATVSRP